MAASAPGGGWRWGGLLRRNAPEPAPVPSDEAVLDHARQEVGVLARWDELHAAWLVALDEQRRSERLANAAAVYHWQLSALRDQLEASSVPRALLRQHQALLEALNAAITGTRRLSQGYRFHVVRVICDGGVLLEEARDQAQAVRETLQSALGLTAGAA